MPELFTSYNSSLPFTTNYNGLWAGRGFNVRALGGIELRWTHARVVLAPQLALAQNAGFSIAPPPFYEPQVASGYSPFSSRWNVTSSFATPYSIDLPSRFGDEAHLRLDAGESGAWVNLRGAELGVTTEHAWWGPGIRNALVLSNNAPGFVHAELRSRAPISTPLGELEARWLVGSVKESDYFSQDPFDNRHSVSAAAVTLIPRFDDRLTIGLTRLVLGPLTSARPLRAFDVFRSVGQPNGRPLADTSRVGSFDQVASLFLHWVIPQDSFAVHMELGRAAEPVSLRDLLTDINYSLGYTLGAEYMRSVGRDRALRLQLELTNLEQSSTYLHRPTPSWYTSRSVRQGFTNDGMTLGAMIGPGSSSQWLAADVVTPTWWGGAFVERIRTNTDAFLVFPFPDGLGFCEFDVTLAPGVRGSGSLARLGRVHVEARLATRFNAFFNNVSGCPVGPARRDVHNGVLAVTFSPRLR